MHCNFKTIVLSFLILFIISFDRFHTAKGHKMAQHNSLDSSSVSSRGSHRLQKRNLVMESPFTYNITEIPTSRTFQISPRMSSDDDDDYVAQGRKPFGNSKSAKYSKLNCSCLFD